jgi:sugar/nucleoside kinase (ribokinase family)
VYTRPVLCVIGDVVEDVVVHLQAPPERATDTPARIVRRRGGSAANVAVAASRAGCPTRFIGRIADDQVGQQLVDDLEDEGVDVRVQRGPGRTGAVVVLVEPGGERTMLPDRAAALELGSIDRSWLEGVTWLHIPAYSLCGEPIGASTIAAAQHVRGSWGRISVDVSSASIVRAFGQDAFRKLVSSLTPEVVFANRDEAPLVAGVATPLLVVKRGNEPVELVVARDQRELVPVDEVPGVADTTGAGDAFAGGFLAATIAGATRQAAVAAGHQSASAVLRDHAAE